MLMKEEKGAYLRQLTAAMPMHSVEVGREMEGSSPPSIFIGSWNYPKVFAGPMIAPVHGDTRLFDTPETWIPSRTTQEEIIGYRLSLVRGKRGIDVADVDGSFAEKLQAIALSSTSLESEVRFTCTPTGLSLSDEHTPHGPSAPIERFSVQNGTWDRDLERVFYDGDLRASEGILGLHRRGIPFSSIQKAFSVGAMGVRRERRLVPTRWSITACDTAIADAMLARVRNYEPIECWRVHEYDSLNNHYAVLLSPGGWEYEWIEAFIRILGSEELVFADHEGHRKKTTYSTVGGCYYSCKMAVLEALERERRQAGAIVLREARSGYVPLGVFNVRENVRSAMALPGKEYEDLASALGSLSGRFGLPVRRFIEESTLLRSELKERQTALSDFTDLPRSRGIHGNQSLPSEYGSSSAVRTAPEMRGR